MRSLLSLLPMRVTPLALYAATVQLTSIVGFGPQTEEVMSIATDSNMPVIVAINKIDIAKPEQIERTPSLFSFPSCR